MKEIEPQVKRPVGMTILLVLSLLNAIYQIVSSLFIFILMPAMRQMVETNQMEDLLESYMPMLDPAMVEMVTENLTVQLSVNPYYYLLLAILYAGSLAGVLRMFRLDRMGFHIYSISQLLILIAEVAFVYSKLPQNPFFNEFLSTVMFILIYYLFFKRIEFMRNQSNQPE